MVTSRLRPSPTTPRRFCWGAWHPLPSIAPHALPTGSVHWGIGMDTYVERLEANGKTPDKGNIILKGDYRRRPGVEAERAGLRAVSVK